MTSLKLHDLVMPKVAHRLSTADLVHRRSSRYNYNEDYHKNTSFGLRPRLAGDRGLINNRKKTLDILKIMLR